MTKWLVGFGSRVIGLASLCLMVACTEQVQTQSSAAPVPTQPTVGPMAGTVALLDQTGKPLNAIASGSPSQLCVALTSAQANETAFAITHENGKALLVPSKFLLGQSTCIAVSFSSLAPSRTDNVTVVAFKADGTQVEQMVLTTSPFSVTASGSTLGCLAVPSRLNVYLQENASHQVAAGSQSTPVTITIDCGAKNGTVSLPKLPDGFRATAGGAPAVGQDGRLYVTGTLSVSGTQTLKFVLTGANDQTAIAPTTLTANGVGIFSCTINQATNQLQLIAGVTTPETYTVNFANRVPVSMEASAPGSGFPTPALFTPSAAYGTAYESSVYTFGGTMNAAGSFSMTVTAQDPLFASKSTLCTTAEPVVVKAPTPAAPPPVTCTLLSISPASLTIPVDPNYKILGQSTLATYSIQLNQPGKVGAIGGPPGSMISQPVAGDNNSFSFSASFPAYGNEALTVPVTDAKNLTTATCNPIVHVEAIVQWPPLTCSLRAEPGTVTIQLDANNQLAARSQGTNFTVTTSRAGAVWGGVNGNGGIGAGGLAVAGTGFTFFGSFFAAPGNYQATVTLWDSKRPGSEAVLCSTSVQVVGRPPITCAVYPNWSEILIATNSANQPLQASQQDAVTIVTSYAASVPVVWGSGSMVNRVPPFPTDYGGQHFTVGVDFTAVGTQVIWAAVAEPNGVSSAQCSNQITVNPFGPAARLNGSGVMGPGQLLCAPTFSLTCWNSIFSPDGQYRLDMENNGNLVLFHLADGLPVWASNTADIGVAYAVMDPVSGYLILKDAAGNGKWWSGGGQFANAVFAVQNDANLVIYQAGAPRWQSATNGWWRGGSLLYKNGFMYCTGTSRNPAAAGINTCVQYTPVGWTMLLDAATYVIESGAQIILNKPMTLSTNGGWGNPTPCFNVPVQGNPDAGTQWTGVGCAQLLADNNAVYPWGGFLIMGNPDGQHWVDSQNYPVPLFTQTNNVTVDHINLNGNYGGRYAVSTYRAQVQSLSEFVNATAANCVSCAFKNSVTQYSLAGGFSLNGNTDNFIADHNSYFWHGNLKEMRNGVLAPRHGGCAFVGGRNSQFTNNFVRHCADEAVLVGSSPNGLVYNNVFYARDNDYSSTEIRIQYGVQTGLRVIYNAIDCADGQCSAGITVGADQFEGAFPNPSGYLYSGLGTDGVQIQFNSIVGANIGILVGFRPVAGHAVYLWNNFIVANGFGQPFQPMACKQWFGTRPWYNCCQPNWDALPMANWEAPYTNFTMSWGGNRIVGTTIMIDPSDWLQVLKDYNNTPLVSGVEAYAAAWRGAGGGGDDSKSCF